MSLKWKDEELRHAVAEKLSTLASAAFGLVAALAWNDAIQTLFRTVFGTQDGLVAKFVYAGVVTVLIVIVTMRIGKLTSRLKKEADEASKTP